MDLLTQQEVLNQGVRRKQEKLVELQNKAHNLKHELAQNEHKKIIAQQTQGVPTAATTKGVIDALAGELMEKLRVVNKSFLSPKTF